ncbi:Villidin [Dirofilaria immitis]
MEYENWMVSNVRKKLVANMLHIFIGWARKSPKRSKDFMNKNKIILIHTHIYRFISSSHTFNKASTIISAVGKDGEELLSTDCDLSLPFSLRQEVGILSWLIRIIDCGFGAIKKLIRLHYVYLTLTALVVMDDFADEIDENELIGYPPIDFDELLRLRTKTSPLEKVTDRDLPSGVGLNRLEQYLNDDEFQSVFQME